MLTLIEAQLSSKVAEDGALLVVTGGFHTVALPGLVGKENRRAVPSSVSPDSVQQALIRYSFQQLDALHGYSAGMPSPNYYNRLWREVAGGSAAAHARVA